MCDMGNPGKDFPCEVAPSQLSRGYAETVSFSVHEQAFKVRQVIEKQLLRERIESIILDNCFVGKDGVNCDRAVDLLVEIMEGK